MKIAYCFLIFLLSACYIEVQQTSDLAENHPIIHQAALAYAQQPVHPHNPAPYDLQIGHTTVLEALQKYPDLVKADSSFIGINRYQAPMNLAYFKIEADGTQIVFQFDDFSQILQNILVLQNPKPFWQLKQELTAQYPIYIQLSADEFDTFDLVGANQMQMAEWFQLHQNDVVMFKQGDVVIILANTIQGNRAIFYRHSPYIPVLRAKAGISS